MKKLLIILIAGFVFFGCTKCKTKASEETESSASGEDAEVDAARDYIVQYHIRIADTLGASSPYRSYWAKFNNYPDLYEISPNKVFNLKYTRVPGKLDSITIMVVAKKATGNVRMAWYTEDIEYRPKCKDTVFMSNFFYNPDPDLPPSSIPTPASQPVPIGITQPPSNQEIP